jgi:hypothetical protein
VKRIDYENYYAQLSSCLCWNAIHYDSNGKKMKKEKFLRDDYYLYKDSLWFNINFKFTREKYKDRGGWRCGGGGSNFNEKYIDRTKRSITVSDFYEVSPKSNLNPKDVIAFKEIVENKFKYPAMFRDAMFNFTDTLTITANKSLTIIYKVDSKNSIYSNIQGKYYNPDYKYGSGNYFLLNDFKKIYPLQNLTEVNVILNDGSKMVLLPIKDESRVTFKVNVVYRISQL